MPTWPNLGHKALAPNGVLGRRAAATICVGVWSIAKVASKAVGWALEGGSGKTGEGADSTHSVGVFTFTSPTSAGTPA